LFLFFFFNDTATTEIYTLSLTTLFRSASLADAIVGPRVTGVTIDVCSVVVACGSNEGEGA